MAKQQRVLYLGSNGFPFGSAMIQRQVQMSKLFLKIGLKVVVINRRSPHSKFISKREKISVYGFFQGVEYFYCSLLSFRSKNILIRNIAKLIGFVVEFLAIIYYVSIKNARYFCCNTINLNELKYYYYLARKLNVKLIYDYVEYIDSIGLKQDTMEFKMDKHSFDLNFIHYLDKLIVISDFLLNHSTSKSTIIPKMKIPPFIDFSDYNQIYQNNNLPPYLLFCGAATYVDVIDFILNSFFRSNAIRKGYKLYLVLYGNSVELGNIKSLIIQKKGLDSIVVLDHIPYFDLLTYYKSAKALLIPLRNNAQDQARFPFKICEYTASMRPIITSDSGSVLEYFEDNINALISKTNDIEDFTKKIDLVVNQPELADEVGRNGYELGKIVFNNESYISRFQNFIWE